MIRSSSARITAQSASSPLTQGNCAGSRKGCSPTKENRIRTCSTRLMSHRPRATLRRCFFFREREDGLAGLAMARSMQNFALHQAPEDAPAE